MSSGGKLGYPLCFFLAKLASGEECRVLSCESNLVLAWVQRKIRSRILSPFPPTNRSCSVLFEPTNSSTFQENLNSVSAGFNKPRWTQIKEASAGLHSCLGLVNLLLKVSAPSTTTLKVHKSSAANPLMGPLSKFKAI